MMSDVSDEALDRFVAACHDVARRGLVRCSCGNLSMRLDNRRFLITTSGSWMSRMSREEVAVCRLDDAAVLNGKKPSSETGFHQGILKMRSEVGVVLHCQTPCATALACRPNENIDYFVIPEVPYYVGHVAWVPYFAPGSAELAEAVTRAMREHDLTLMANHGQVIAGRDFDDVTQKAEFFELACEIILRGGDSVMAMSAQSADELRAIRARSVRQAV